MRPHLMHIAQTIARKQANLEALNEQKNYQKYMKMVERARSLGYLAEHIIKELEEERERIMKSKYEGDALFQDGVKNSKKACINAINSIISELKGETNVFYNDHNA